MRNNQSRLLFSHLANWGYQELCPPKGDVPVMLWEIPRTILLMPESNFAQLQASNIASTFQLLTILDLPCHQSQRKQKRISERKYHLLNETHALLYIHLMTT